MADAGSSARPTNYSPGRGASNGTVVSCYGQHAQAERAVDYLADHAFPVEHIRIVGEELATVERVTGRVTTSRAAVRGAGSGAVVGSFLGLLLGLFSVMPLAALLLALYGALAGAGFGAVAGALNHAALRGRRDFSSEQAIVAGRYNVVCDDPEHARRASGLLSRLPD